MSNEPAKNPPPSTEDESFSATLRIEEGSLRKQMLAVLLKRVATANTDAIEDENPILAPQTVDLEKAGFIVLPRRYPWLIQLSGLAQGKALGVAVVGEVSIGLGAAGTPNAPDFDLTPYGGAERGVSRLHMLLRPKKAELVIVDLNSTNGTRLNGELIEAGQEKALKQGDLISLGALTTTIKIIATPEDFEEAAQAARGSNEQRATSSKPKAASNQQPAASEKPRAADAPPVKSGEKPEAKS